jgi:hypothetical protein
MPRTKHDIEDFTLAEDGEAEPSGIRSFFGRDKKPKDAPKERMPRGHPNLVEVTELISLANLPLAMLSPRDAFTPFEVERLSGALDSYCKTSERARKFVYGIVRKSAILAFLECGFMIALPRMIRHGLLPKSIGPYLLKIDAIDKLQMADAMEIQLEQDENGTWGFRAPSPNGVVPEDSRPADIEHIPTN